MRGRGGVLPGQAGDEAADNLQQHLVEVARERDDAYRKLQEREAELARIQRIARVGGVEVEFRDGFRNRRSPEYLMIHGLGPEAVNETHQDWVNRIHPDDRARTVKHFDDVLAGTSTEYSAEYRIVRPNDGQVRWIGVTAEIERDAAGRAVRLVGAHIDITDRMLIQESLRESEERFRLIADSAPVPIWVTKLDRRRAFANQAYLDFLALPYEEAVVYDWRKALHPDDLDRILQEQLAGESSLQPFVLEARYRRADGQWRWLRSESQPRWDPTGKHIGFIGVAHDITAAKEAEVELRRLNETLEQRIRERTRQLQSNEAQMRAIFETSNQYHVLLDLEGAIVYANRTSLAGIRATEAEIVGTAFWASPWFAASEATRARIRDAFAAAARGETVRSELNLSLPAGDRFFDFALRPVLDRRKAVSGVLAEAVDVTERRQGEEVLRQSQKMEAVGQLTGGVAHDFNNFLTIIRSAIDFLRRRDLSSERRRRYVDAIADTVDRASRLTGQLLAFARRQPLKPQVFNVASQVETIAEFIRPLVGSRYQIAVEIHDDTCFASADIAQFETALINLAVNARDAMADGGRMTIAVRKASAIPALRTLARRAGDFIAVSVTDVGTGIAADKLEMIFEPFYTTKEVGKGTGLGLSQAFGFAKQSGGDIEVRSAPDKGSSFIIYLPQAAAAASPDVAVAASESAVRGRGHSILVVEDNEDIGHFTTELLEDLGYAIRWVANAADALTVLADDARAFDLVFSDVIMPGMNGVDLAVTIRDRYPGLPVVLTSGYSTVLAENGDLGFELIRKPYSFEVLSRTLRRAIADGTRKAG
ncbi:MAG: PAS domain S-box protein [Xanthobacteraceae bacterium]